MNRNRRICIGGQTSRKSGMKSRKSERDGINRGIPESGSRAKILGLGRKNVLGMGVTSSPNCFLEQLRAESSWIATPQTVAHQAPLSMGFSRQEYWSGVPLPSPGDLPDPGIEPRSPSLQADTLTSEPPGLPTYLVLILNVFERYLYQFSGAAITKSTGWVT